MTAAAAPEGSNLPAEISVAARMVVFGIIGASGARRADRAAVATRTTKTVPITTSLNMTIFELSPDPVQWVRGLRAGFPAFYNPSLHAGLSRKSDVSRMYLRTVLSDWWRIGA